MFHRQYANLNSDVRASEEQGSEPMIAERFFDTKLPSNINDTDIWPGMTEMPIEREGATEMTFDLVRYEIGGTVRILSALSKCPKESKASEQDQLESKDAALERLRLKLEDKYLKYCDNRDPLQWVAANVSRLVYISVLITIYFANIVQVMAKIWLVIHHPFRRGALGAKLAQETRNRTFLTSIDIIRYARLLETQQKTLRWGWLFSSYRQWHSLAFLLGELCVRTEGPAVEDGWRVIEEAWPAWDTPDVSKHLPLWKAITRLMVRARAVRREVLEKRKAFPVDGTLGPAPTNNDSSLSTNSVASAPAPATNFDINPVIYNDTVPTSYNEIPDMGMDINKSVKDTADFDPYGLQSSASFFPSSNQLTDMNVYPRDATDFDLGLTNPLAQDDILPDTNINWSSWDAEMGMDLQNEIVQPINIDLDQLWGGFQQN